MKQNIENEDAELMSYYRLGMQDGYMQRDRYIGGSPIDKAYNLGKEHSKIDGDLWTNEELLKMIKELIK